LLPLRRAHSTGDPHTSCLDSASNAALIWADDAQWAIHLWSAEASLNNDAALVAPVAAQAEWWTEHIARGDGDLPCPDGKCLHYWQDGADIEEMTFCVDDVDVAPLVATGWLARVHETEDIYCLSWPWVVADLSSQ
jgi:hypothetical protein